MPRRPSAYCRSSGTAEGYAGISIKPWFMCLLCSLAALDIFAYLSADGLGHLIDELDDPHPFVFGQLVVAEVSDREFKFLVWIVPVIRYDYGLDGLAPERVGNTYDAAFHHGGGVPSAHFPPRKGRP